jgi:dolichol-phosphate mannosyltransferase
MSKSLVIIPTYNEKENIEPMIRTIMAFPEGFHILIVDDNSPDGTGEIVEQLTSEFQKRLHLLKRSGKLGLGTAYITGFKWALENDYDFIFEMDADFSHDPAYLSLLLETCKNSGADVAIGSRYISGVNVVNWPIGRILMSYFASMYVRTITGMPVRDTTAGFKCYRKKVLETIHLDKIRFRGYAFQIEMKFAAWKLGFHIIEVPIVFTERKLGTSKMSGGIFSEAVWGVIRMKISSLFHSYRN